MQVGMTKHRRSCSFDSSGPGVDGTYRLPRVLDSSLAEELGETTPVSADPRDVRAKLHVGWDVVGYRSRGRSCYPGECGTGGVPLAQWVLSSAVGGRGVV